MSGYLETDLATEISAPVNESLKNDLSISGEASHAGAIVIGFISAAGLLCNIVVIVVIIALKDFKKTTHWYVLNLSIADSLFLSLLPLNLMQNVSGKWTLGLRACILFQGGFYVNYYAGVLFLAVMSFDRYVAIAHPVSKSWRRIRSKIGCRILALAVWCIAIAAAAPLMTKTTVNGGVCDFSFEFIHPECEANGINSANHCELWRSINSAQLDHVPADDSNLENVFYNAFTDGYEDVYEDIGANSQTPVPENFTPVAMRNPEMDECYSEVSDDYVTWIIGNFVISFVIPLTVMAFCYGGILYHIQHPKIRASSRSGFTMSRKRKSNNEKKSKVDKKIRITFLVVSLVVVFIFCWSPLHGVVLARLRGINLSNDACYKLRNAAVLIAYSNSLLNPIMYTFLGINFCKRLKIASTNILGRSMLSKISPSSTRGHKGRTTSVNCSKTTKISSSSEPHILLSTFASHTNASSEANLQSRMIGHHYSQQGKKSDT